MKYIGTCTGLLSLKIDGNGDLGYGRRSRDLDSLLVKQAPPTALNEDNSADRGQSRHFKLFKKTLVRIGLFHDGGFVRID